MNKENKTKITIEATINAYVDTAWKYFTRPEYITKWNHASDDWHSPRAENDLREGGKFSYTMAAKDGSQSFDFEGTYIKVDPYRLIEYEIADGRNVKIYFAQIEQQTHITSIFEADDSHPVEMQKEGWQAILNNFKKFVESED